MGDAVSTGGKHVAGNDRMSHTACMRASINQPTFILYFTKTANFVKKSVCNGTAKTIFLKSLLHPKSV